MLPDLRTDGRSGTRGRYLILATEYPQLFATWRPLGVIDKAPPPGELGRAGDFVWLHERVLAMTDLQDSIGKGVAWLDKYAASRGAGSFAALDEMARLAALDAAFASADDGIRPFVFALRQQFGRLYYADPAIKKAFAYSGPPQPEGFPDFQERPR